jgi:tRNA threonylcarbamoyladenosine biosynthesis protein TsaE
VADDIRVFRVLDEERMTAIARRLATRLDGGATIHLRGDLGAGKTTFARALLATLGVGERVRSPTYSLVESYALDGRRAHHLDLYRIADPGELEWLGLDALAEPGALVLIEWPERGGSAVPPPDLDLRLAHAGPGRDLAIRARTPRGAWLLEGIPEDS